MKTSLILLFACIFFFSCENLNVKNAESDPYLWLEEIEGEQPLEWIKARNSESRNVIAKLPLYDSLKSRFLGILNDTDKLIWPNIIGDHVYDLWKDGTHERGLWRRTLLKEFLDGKSDWETLIDLDELSEKENKKWVYKGAEWLAPEYKICLVSLSDGGKDEVEIREFDTERKVFTEGGFFVPESKGGVGWIDANTILVTTDFGEGTMTTSGYPRMAKIWSRDKTLEEADLLLEADTSTAGIWPIAIYSSGRQYSFVYNWVSTFETELFYVSNNSVDQIEYPLDAVFAGIHKNQMIFNLQSDWSSGGTIFSAGSLISFDLDENLKGNFTINTIYTPDERSSYTSLLTTKDFMVVNTMENVQNKLLKYTFDDTQWNEEPIETPDFGSIVLLSSSDLYNAYFFRYSNLITPATLFYADGQKRSKIKQAKSYFDSNNLVVNQFEATSKDGTMIPYFMVHRNDIELNGKNPTLIYAYGGFNISERPNYSSITGVGWLEQGGIYVLANIRGGGEFGPSWHKSAMKENRQNAYNDFFAVTEDLISRGYTTPRYLGAFGWSNGGLLTGVVLTQKPDLFNAIIIGAPLLDMKRYSKMLAGASWVGEYGDPDKPEDWAYIQKYSPYHNVKKDIQYPEALFITSIKDDRVHPGHARKMAAKMTDMGHPVLYYETIEGGHGAATTNEQRADLWAIMYTYLNMKLR